MSSQYSPTSIVVVAVVLPIFSLIAVSLRFLVRLKIQPSRLGIDDWLIVGAVIFLLGDCAVLAVSAILGIQGHVYEGQIPPERQMLENKTDYVTVIIEKPLYGLMKTSMLFFYRRIFTSHKRFLHFNAFAIALVAVWSFAYMLAEMFVCGGQPEVLWSPTGDPAAVCGNRNDLNLTYAITDVITDMLVVFMPFHVIRSLHMDGRQKLGVAFIFMLGTLSTVASIIRLGFISLAYTQDYGAFNVNKHAAGTPPAVWSTIEGAIGVLAACLPPLGPLIRKTPHASQMSSKIYEKFASVSSRTRRPSYAPFGLTNLTNKTDVSDSSEATERNHSKVSRDWYARNVESPRKGSILSSPIKFTHSHKDSRVQSPTDSSEGRPSLTIVHANPNLPDSNDLDVEKQTFQHN